MARSLCVTPMRGSAVRFVEVDNCGRVQYGTCSAFNTTAVRELNFSADTDEGDAVEINNIAGDRCVYAPPKPQHNGYEIEMSLCRYDPLLISRLVGADPITNEDGTAVGHVVPETAGQDGVGMAMVIWHSIYVGEREACRGGNRRATRYLVKVVPWTTRWIPGDQELAEGGEDGVPLAFTGHTQLGMVTNLAGLVGGPVEPLTIPDGSLHELWVVTSVPPPRDECGCVEVVRPIPDPAQIFVQRDGNSTNRAQVWVDNHGFGPVTLDCGIDGSTKQIAEFETTYCTYPDDGDYTITACDVQTPAVCAQRDVTIPLPPDEPELTVEADSEDPQGLTVLLTVDNHGNGPVDINWGDGGQPQRVANPDGQESFSHSYPRAGIYQIRVTDVDEPDRNVSEVVVVPVADPPVFSLQGGAQQTDVEVLGDDANQPSQGRARTFVIDWGDGTPKTSSKLTSDDVVQHSYDEMGTYTITVSDMASPLARRSETVELPVPGDRPGRPGEPTLTWEAADAPGRPGAADLSWQAADTPDAPGQATLTWQSAQAVSRTNSRRS